MAKRTAKEYIKALEKSGGLVAPAARRLGVTRAAVYAMAKNHPTVKAAMDDARADVLDLCESNIFKAVSEGNLNMSTYLLDRLGKDRGYVTRQEVEQPRFTAREVSEMSHDELNQYTKELGLR